MPVIAQLEGLPANADANAVIFAVRKVIQKLKISFWVHDLSNCAETDKKICKIKFFNKQDANKVINRLTSRPQTIIGVQCELKITIVSESTEEESNKEGEGNSRDRSRSPISKEEANIDKELNKLKKEKDELEKRKSELLKKKMNIEQKDAKTDQKDSTSKKTVEATKSVKMYHSILPKFTPTEVAIIEDMKQYTKPHAQKRYYQNFMQSVHVEIRTRLAILLESNNNIQKTGPTGVLVKAYRAKYPKENDASTIESIYSQVKMAFWPYKGKNRDSADELFKYDESEEEDAADDNQDLNAAESITDESNKMENVENDTTSVTEDTESPTAEEDENMGEVLFEGGTNWNDEENMVSAVTVT